MGRGEGTSACRVIADPTLKPPFKITMTAPQCLGAQLPLRCLCEGEGGGGGGFRASSAGSAGFEWPLLVLIFGHTFLLPLSPKRCRVKDLVLESMLSPDGKQDLHD